MTTWLTERTEWLTFAVGFVAFALMTAPGVTWMDSGELAAAAYELGGAHPPGHPVHTLLGKLASLVPLGEIAWRINMLSALTMALALAGVVALMRALVRDAHPAFLAAAGLLLASPVVQLNATRTEVYAPTVALLVWSAVALVRALRSNGDTIDGRGLLLCAFGSGLAAACHPLIAVSATAPMAALALYVLRARLLRLAPAALGLGCLGLCAYLYLPIRANAATPPLFMWKNPTDLSALWELLTAPEYRGNFAAPGLGDRLVKLSFLAADGNGAGLFWGGLAGLLFAALTGLRAAGLVLLCGACALVGAAAQSYFNPDMPGYVLIALMLFAVGLAPLHGALVRVIRDSLREPWAEPWAATWRPRSGIVAGVVLIPVIGFGLLTPTVHIEDPGFRRGDDPMRFVMDTVERIPPGPGVFLGNHDHSLFTAQYERLVAGNRPDIAIANAYMVRDRWFLAHIKRMLPALYVPYIDDGARGSLAARLIAGNVQRGLPAAGDQPAFGQLKLDYSRPLGRGYQYFLTRVTDASLPPAERPAAYVGGIGARVSGRMAVDRARMELFRGRLVEAAVALGGDRDKARATLAELPGEPDRTPLLRFVPYMSKRFIYEPWETDLALDELQWLAGLSNGHSGDGLPGEELASDERRVHARWRTLLTDVSALDPARDDVRTAMRLGSLLIQRGRAHDLQRAEVFFRFATDAGGSDPEPWLRLGQVYQGQGRPEQARAAWTQALKRAPGSARLQRLIDSVSPGM